VIIELNDPVRSRDGNVLIIKKEMKLGFEVFRLYSYDERNESTIVAESFSPVGVTRRLQQLISKRSA